MHVTSVQQFLDGKLLNEVFEQTRLLKECKDGAYPQHLNGKVVATLFYEPSTRTRLSFETAVLRLGGKVVGTESAGMFSSAIKGETLADTVRVVAGYADAIVLRHPEKGAASIAAAVSSVPIINAGDGSGEHPTQALLDLFTIIEAKGQIEGLRIGLVGDLLNGRTIHSLVYLLSMYRVRMHLIAPSSLQLPAQYLRYMKQQGVEFTQIDTWDEVIPELDVLYMTRIQKERFASQVEYEEVYGCFQLDDTVAKRMKSDAIILHPLPRLNEINASVDSDSRAWYFRQAENGLFVRMALLVEVFAKQR